MRDVKSINYFEQMKGRGTRTINSNDLKLVSKTANTKTHFVIVDAVGATKSKKTDSRPLERKPSVPLKDLMGAVSMGHQDEDLFLSLANRLIRLEKQITDKEKDRLLELSGGKNLKQITKELITAYDADAIEERAQQEISKIPEQDQTPAVLEEARKKAQEQLILEASKTFNGPLNEYLDNVRKQHEQIIDGINIDTVTKSEWEITSVDNARQTIKDFTEYLEAHKDEIQALSIFYNQPYNRRNITFNMIKEVMEKLQLEKPQLTPDYVWDAFVTLNASSRAQSRGEVPSKPKDQLTALVSLIRKACGIDKDLKPFDKTIEKNFNDWLF